MKFGTLVRKWAREIQLGPSIRHRRLSWPRSYKGALVLLALSLGTSLQSRASQVPHIDVLIGKSLKSIVVSGVDIRRDLLLEGDVKQHQGHKTVKFNCLLDEEELEKARKKQLLSRNLLAQVSSPTGVLSWNSAKYRGEFFMATAEDVSGCHLINRISLENYLSSLLAKEMNPHWPIEALKAQAVAARTYALYQMENRQRSLKLGKKVFFDLENSEKNQVSGGLLDESQKTNSAVKQTRGEILVSNAGKMTPIFFHSKCGGKTLVPSEVWERSMPEYASVECPFCREHGEEGWTYELSARELQGLMKKYSQMNKEKVGKGGASKQNLDLSDMRLLPDREENNKIRFQLQGDLHILRKVYLRRFLGREKIKSNNYVLSKKSDSRYLVKGKGLGHGVGMCQFGALELADRGWGYKKILRHYFPNHTLKNIY